VARTSPRTVGGARKEKADLKSPGRGNGEKSRAKEGDKMGDSQGNQILLKKGKKGAKKRKDWAW